MPPVRYVLILFVPPMFDYSIDFAEFQAYPATYGDHTFIEQRLYHKLLWKIQQICVLQRCYNKLIKYTYT